MSSYSVFIPRVFSNIRQERISEIFDKKSIGKVSSVDLVPKKNHNGDTTHYYNMAFVHFERLYDTSEALAFRSEVDNIDVKAKLMYDDPWFWIVLPFEQKEKPTTNTDRVRDPMDHPSSSEPVLPIQQTRYPTAVQNMLQFYTEQPLLPYWIMSPHGPIWQWGYAPHPNMVVPSHPLSNFNNGMIIDTMLQHYQPSTSQPSTSQPSTSQPSTSQQQRHSKKMIPRQVMYGKLNNNHRQSPRKRVNVSSEPEPRSVTYARETNHVTQFSTGDREEGEDSEDEYP